MMTLREQLISRYVSNTANLKHFSNHDLSNIKRYNSKASPVDQIFFKDLLEVSFPTFTAALIKEHPDFAKEAPNHASCIVFYFAANKISFVDLFLKSYPINSKFIYVHEDVLSSNKHIFSLSLTRPTNYMYNTSLELLLETPYGSRKTPTSLYSVFRYFKEL